MLQSQLLKLPGGGSEKRACCCCAAIDLVVTISPDCSIAIIFCTKGDITSPFSLVLAVVVVAEAVEGVGLEAVEGVDEDVAAGTGILLLSL